MSKYLTIFIIPNFAHIIFLAFHSFLSLIQTQILAQVSFISIVQISYNEVLNSKIHYKYYC